MSKYGYLEVFQRVPSISRLRESTVYVSSKSIKVCLIIEHLPKLAYRPTLQLVNFTRNRTCFILWLYIPVYKLLIQYSIYFLKDNERKSFSHGPSGRIYVSTDSGDIICPTPMKIPGGGGMHLVPWACEDATPPNPHMVDCISPPLPH